jgi:hypothetical protein
LKRELFSPIYDFSPSKRIVAKTFFTCTPKLGNGKNTLEKGVCFGGPSPKYDEHIK